MKRFQIYFPVQTWTKLKAESKALGISIAEIVRRIIDRFFEDKTGETK